MNPGRGSRLNNGLVKERSRRRIVFGFPVQAGGVHASRTICPLDIQETRQT